MNVTLRPEAQEDLEGAAQWYEEQAAVWEAGCWMKLFARSAWSRKTHEAIPAFTENYVGP